MTSRIYCTYCDHRYLPRALALRDSMLRHGFDGEFWLYCLSDECYRILVALDLPGIRVIALPELEAFYPELLATKSQRTLIEYYYTCAPAILHYAFAHAPEAEWVTFLDSDLWFFESPDRVFEEIADAPVTIIPHNFVPRMKWLEKFGVYNVGWVTFRRGGEGEACLEWWRTKCIEWCFGHIDGDRYADQRYLDRFAQVAPATRILTHKGCNLAPWNIENYVIGFENGKVVVDDQPLLFFHFHGLKKALGHLFFDNHRYYGAQHSRIIRNRIYKPYVQNLLDAEDTLKRSLGHEVEAPVKPRSVMQFGSFDVQNTARTLLRGYNQAIDIVGGWPIVARGNRAI